MPLYYVEQVHKKCKLQFSSCFTTVKKVISVCVKMTNKHLDQLKKHQLLKSDPVKMSGATPLLLYTPS